MKIAVGQEAKEAKNEEKEHAVIFTTGASGLMKPGTTTDMQKNEELLSKSINWKSM